MWPLTAPALTAPLGAVTSSEGRLFGFSRFLRSCPPQRCLCPLEAKLRFAPTLAFPCPTHTNDCQCLMSPALSFLTFRLSLDHLWVSMVSFSRAGLLVALFLCRG